MSEWTLGMLVQDLKGLREQETAAKEEINRLKNLFWEHHAGEKEEHERLKENVRVVEEAIRGAAISRTPYRHLFLWAGWADSIQIPEPIYWAGGCCGCCPDGKRPINRGS